MFCLCLCPRICLCVCLCRCLCHLRMNPGNALFPAMYDMWVAMLKSLECGCLSIIGLLTAGWRRWWKPRLGRHPMGPTTNQITNGQDMSRSRISCNLRNCEVEFCLSWCCFCWCYVVCLSQKWVGAELIWMILTFFKGCWKNISYCVHKLASWGLRKGCPSGRWARRCSRRSQIQAWLSRSIKCHMWDKSCLL